tara:strand:+ start:714 stop:893 length:180 start_codon:yes stop_codon:yes gene_type:complete
MNKKNESDAEPEIQKNKNSIESPEKANQKNSGRSVTWDLDEDNCGIDASKNPCGDANEY